MNTRRIKKLDQIKIKQFGIKCRDRKIIMQKLSVGGARGVVVIVVENGHGDTSSNPR